MDVRPPIARASDWLASLELHEAREQALRAVGIKLAAAAAGEQEPRLPATAAAALPSVAQLVTMKRDDLARICNRIARSVSVERPAAWERQCWQAVLPALCISYARDADAVAVASLVRLAVRIGLDPASLEEAVTFLLEQQADDGSFGLVADGGSSGSDPTGAGSPQLLRLTVEVIWALASVAAAENSADGAGAERPAARAR